jgi:hypothetical protein
MIEQIRNLSREIKLIKQKTSANLGLKNTRPEIRKSLKGFNNILDTTEESASLNIDL